MSTPSQSPGSTAFSAITASCAASHPNLASSIPRSTRISMVRTPTEEQRLVIESPAKQFMVTASAGARKTFVLVERYLWMIEQLGFEPHEILTITFAREAAAEMKERIVGRLRSMGQFDRAQIAETGPI